MVNVISYFYPMYPRWYYTGKNTNLSISSTRICKIPVNTPITIRSCRIVLMHSSNNPSKQLYVFGCRGLVLNHVKRNQNDCSKKGEFVHQLNKGLLSMYRKPVARKFFLIISSSNLGLYYHSTSRTLQTVTVPTVSAIQNWTVLPKRYENSPFFAANKNKQNA